MPKPRFGEDKAKSEQPLDLFSHDSTHVQLVIEAEKQSNLARLKAMDILSKYSRDVQDETKDVEDTKDAKDVKDTRDMNDTRDKIENNDNEEATEEERDDDERDITTSSSYYEVRNQYMNDKEEIPCDDDYVKSQKDDIFNNKFGELTDEDIEHIARCIVPLSPKGLKRNKVKNVSGRFEFKRINTGTVSVVKSHEKLTIISKEELSKAAGKAIESKNKSTQRGRKKKGLVSRIAGRSRSRSRSRMRSRSRNRDMDSGIMTDDACLQNVDEQTVQNNARLQPRQEKPVKLNKEVKRGDLPPKPMPKPNPIKRERSFGAPSSRATASDEDYEEVISVESSMSPLSEVSVAEKMKQRGPIVLTQGMLDTAVIPEMICLKTYVKLTKIQKLKRKLSFSKGRI